MKYGVKSKTSQRYLQEFGSYGEARVFTLKQRQVWNNATMQIYEIYGLLEDLLVEQFNPTKGANYNKITNMKTLTKQKPTRYKMSRFEDSELKPTQPQTATANSYLLSNKLVDDNDSTSSAKNAQHCSWGCLHTAQCLYRMRDIQSKEKVVK